MRIALYTRVSDKDQATGYSLGYQSKLCREYATRQSWQIVGEYQDVMTGTRADRPGYQAMLAAKATWDAVLVWRFDRLGRNEEEFFPTVAQLARLGKQPLSATEPSGSPVITGILAVLAADESRRNSARVKPALTARASEGKWNGMMAFGMVYGADGRPMPDPDPRCHAVDIAYEMYAHSDCALADVAAHLNALGYRTRTGVLWSAPVLYRMFKRPVYCGDIVQSGVTIERNHQGRVSRELWQAVQQRLADRRNNALTGRSERVPGLGIVWCHCSARMLYNRKVGVPGRAYYRCTARFQRRACDQPSLRADVLDEYLWQTFRGARLTAATEGEVDALLDQRLGKPDEGTRQRLSEAIALVSKLQARERNLIEDLADRVIDRVQFRGVMLDVRNQLTIAQGEASRLRAELNRPSGVELLKQAARWLLSGIRERGISREDLPAIVADAIERIVVGPGLEIRLEWRPGWEAILEVGERKRINP